MKKLFKILSIIVIIIAVLGGLVIGGAFAIEGFGTLKRRNNRINNSKTLSQYIEYHNWEYTGSTFTALEFYAKDIKCDLLKDREIVHYIDYGGNYGILVLDDYTIYETAFLNDKVYSNGQQYKKIETDIKIKRTLQDSSIIYLMSEDNKCYMIDFEKKEIVPNDRNTTSKYLVEKNETIKKFITNSMTENGNLKYIVLKTDGQIYEQEYKYDYDAFGIRMALLKEDILYSNEEYGHITDAYYSYYGEEMKSRGITRIVSDKGVFYLKQTNEQIYIDTEPTYEMVASDIYNKYKADIKYINCEYVFTTDNNIIKTDMLCRDIDKEVK